MDLFGVMLSKLVATCTVMKSMCQRMDLSLAFGGTLHPDFHTTYPNLHSSQQGAKGLYQFLGEYVSVF